MALLAHCNFSVMSTLLLSDHQPLHGLFKETKGIPSMASASIRYKKGSDNSNADLLKIFSKCMHGYMIENI